MHGDGSTVKAGRNESHTGKATSVMDPASLITGFAAGAAASLLYFAGLGLGLRVALRSGHLAAVLFLSASIRMALLLLAGWAAARLGLWSVAGFGAAFLMVRLGVVRWVRPPLGREGG